MARLQPGGDRSLPPWTKPAEMRRQRSFARRQACPKVRLKHLTRKNRPRTERNALAVMRRRDFLPVAGAAAMLPRLVGAQSSLPIVGYLSNRSPAAETPLRIGFLRELEQ